MRTVLLLILSNVFMTFAWYGHLKFKTAPLLVVILASWLIALPEYICQVPANRLGHGHYGYSAAQLKILQEAITLVVFVIFAALYLGERPRWNEALGLLLIAAAVYCVFMLNPRASDAQAASAGAEGISQTASAFPSERGTVPTERP